MKVLNETSGNSLESIQNPAIFCTASGTLSRGEAKVRLEPRAGAVLAALISEPDQVVSRQALLDGCWGEGVGSDEALTQAVSQIRKAAASLGLANPVRTYAKRGYAIVGDAIQSGRLPSTATSAEPAGPDPSRSTVSRRIVLVGIAAALILGWLLMPHGPRHWIRHSLGLYQSGSGNQAGH